MTRPPIFESYSSEMPPHGEESLPISKPAVFGFLLSLLQCLPLLAGVGAVILGGIGLADTRRGRAIGKPLAILAILIGSVSILAWAVVITAAVIVQTRFEDATATADRFIEALAQGRLEDARAMASDRVSDDELVAWAMELSPQAQDTAPPRVNTAPFAFDDANVPSVSWFFSGPFSVSSTIRYGVPGEPGQGSKSASTTVARENGRFRPVSLRVRTMPGPGGRVLIGPDGSPLPPVPELGEIPGVRVVAPPAPATRPATQPRRDRTP